MSIKIFLYLYILFFSSVSLISYKKGIYLLWLTILLMPWMILKRGVFLSIPLVEILICISVLSELLTNDSHIFKKYFSRHTVAILTYLSISLCILFFSEVVPLKTQFRYLREEMFYLLFGIQTFLLLKKDPLSSKNLFRIVCITIVFNVIYCLIFEVILRFNPAGMPLYVLLGIDDNEFIVDMIEYERGVMNFRLQSVYAHPLSLAQYLLLMYPLFFMKEQIRLRLLYIVAICIIVILTGSRSSIFPLAIISLFFMIYKSKGVLIKNLILLLVASYIIIELLPNQRFVEKQEGLVTAYIQFWDEKKQINENVRGSTMEMRINQFDAAIKEMDRSPVFGLGYGYRGYWIYIHQQLHPILLGFESVFLLQLVERGWVGLIFYFIMLFFLYRQFSRRIKDKKVIIMIFVGFTISIVMTGVRPASLLILCLTGCIANGMSPYVQWKST